MASARLQITVESAHNLYNADGFLAGKSDPYVVVEVLGQENMKFQTRVINNDLNPMWNETGEISGFMDGDVLQFTVMDKDTFPKPDQLLGKACLMASDFYPNGLQAELQLEESKTSATLAVMVAVLGCEEEPGMEEGAVAACQGMQQMGGSAGQLQPGMAVEGDGMLMASGERTLLVNIMNARGLDNADGFLAGKSDPYCICLIPEKPECKFQTPVINNNLDPEWNHTGRIEGFQAGDSLEFQVWDSDTFPKPDQLLGKVTLTAEDMAAHPEGLAGVLALQGSREGNHETATLEICVQAETGMEMQASHGAGTGVMVASSTQPYPGTTVMAGPTSTYSAVSVPSQSCYSGSPVTYSSFPTTQTMTPTIQTMTYGAPQTTYSTPHAASMSLVSQPSPTYSASGQVSQPPQAGSMSIMSHPAMTYSAPSSLGMSEQQQGGQTAGKVLQVIVHPPVTVTAQDFAQSNGTIISTPLPVTTVTGSALERGIVETTAGIVGTTETAFEKVVKKKKSKSCC